MGGKGSKVLHVITLVVDDFQQAHLYVLNNSDEVFSYILRHEGLCWIKWPRNN